MRSIIDSFRLSIRHNPHIPAISCRPRPS